MADQLNPVRPETVDAAITIKGHLDDLVRTEGWKVVEAFYSDQIEFLLKQCDGVKSGEEALRIVGQISGLRTLCRWPRLQSNILAQQINAQQPVKGKEK